MKKVHTHYDNLKVSRDAPFEVIRAAYKTLCQKYHPDHNPGNSDAARIMSLVNASYDVLSDPIKRLQHDRWIREIEESAQSNIPSPKETPTTSGGQAIKENAPPPKRKNPTSGFLWILNPIFEAIRPLLKLAAALFLGVMAIFIVIGTLTPGGIMSSKKSQPAASKPDDNRSTYPLPESTQPRQKYETAQPAAQPSAFPSRVSQAGEAARPAAVPPKKVAYVRPAKADNGQPWPQKAGYIAGYPRLNNSGLSSVTIDNSRNDADVYVKLINLAGAKPSAVRNVFIPATSRFTLEKVAPGKYDVRYRDLTTGQFSKSESFALEEKATASGTEYSDLTMTLYKVQNGNMQTYSIDESDF